MIRKKKKERINGTYKISEILLETKPMKSQA
jgi:hypothetical protein